ncbi:MAG: hypothetical protein C0507_15460 [Cyanobacteria bacterium PR.3.49]|nr:hypothetical protein [Cyanobacteria bacterium PR.3.49]
MVETSHRAAIDKPHPKVHSDADAPRHLAWGDLFQHRERPDPSAYQPGKEAHEFVQKHLHHPELVDFSAGHGARNSAEKSGETKDDAERRKEISARGDRVADILKKDPHDFKHAFEELDSMRKKDPQHLAEKLRKINDTLHEKGLLKGMTIVRDDRHGHEGWAVVAEDHGNVNPNHNKTMVSTSHAPGESAALKHHYSSMHYRRGHYNGWHQSVEGGGGAHGGFDKHAVGGHVPPGARRELIEKALQLAGVPVTEQNISAVNKIVTRESGWNPNITNNWDINAKRGHPSTGLMQTIPSTFNKFALPGMNSNIHDPLSNLVAGIRYAEARYGKHGMSGVARVASRPGGY